MKGWLSSLCHQPQPPSSCWNVYRRSSPACIFSLSEFSSIGSLRFSSRIALFTMRSGRKLDIVCSTQPYGNEVRKSRALKMLPAIEVDSRIDKDREPGAASEGNVKSSAVDAVLASVPLFA